MTPFVALVGFVFVLALSGKKPGRGSYAAVALGACVLALWEYVH